MSDFYLAIFENTSIESFIVISLTTAVMFWLCWKDFKSYKNSHKDYKSVIVSTGVLGTFIGIFIGLLGFDSANVSSSVPRLLDGLKTAFITSIVGMFLAILTSIIQKRKGGEAGDEITILGNIEKKLDTLNSVNERLSNLEEIKKSIKILPLINTNLDSIDTNIKVLSEDISSVKKELKVNQEALFNFLKDKLANIDNSLKEAVQTLSKGATEEIIKALENVIQDFNSNLTEQFGDNFKQLNESVLKLIEWQNSYKDSVQEFEKQLKLTTENTEASHQKTTELIDKFVEQATERFNKLFEQTSIAVSITQDNAKYIKEVTDSYATITKISEKLETILSTNQNQIQNLENHLQALAEIGENAKNITEQLKNFSNGIQGSLTNQSESLSKLTKEIEDQLPKSLDTLNQSLTSLTQQFTKDYEAFLEAVSKLMRASNTN